MRWTLQPQQPFWSSLNSMLSSPRFPRLCCTFYRHVMQLSQGTNSTLGGAPCAVPAPCENQAIWDPFSPMAA